MFDPTENNFEFDTLTSAVEGFELPQINEPEIAEKRDEYIAQIMDSLNLKGLQIISSNNDPIFKWGHFIIRLTDINPAVAKARAELPSHFTFFHCCKSFPEKNKTLEVLFYCNASTLEAYCCSLTEISYDDEKKILDFIKFKYATRTDNERLVLTYSLRIYEENIHEYDRKKSIISFKDRLDIANKLIKFAQLLRDKNFIYTDFKPSNLFLILKEDLNIEISDTKSLRCFTSQMPLNDLTKGLMITAAYCPPELISGCRNFDEYIQNFAANPEYEKIMVYQLGIVIYQIITGISSELLAHLVGCENQLIFELNAFNYYKENVLTDLIQSMIKLDARERITLDAAFEVIKTVKIVDAIEKVSSANHDDKTSSLTQFFKPEKVLPNLRAGLNSILPGRLSSLRK